MGEITIRQPHEFALVLASVRLSNCTCGFPACISCKDSTTPRCKNHLLSNHSSRVISAHDLSNWPGCDLSHSPTSCSTVPRPAIGIRIDNSIFPWRYRGIWPALPADFRLHISSRYFPRSKDLTVAAPKTDVSWRCSESSVPVVVPNPFDKKGFLNLELCGPSWAILHCVIVFDLQEQNVSGWWQT